MRRHKAYADARRSSIHIYRPGDKVWLSTRDLHLRLPCQKLSPCYIGPFTIKRQINEVTFRLQLPARYRIHLAFNFSLLKPVSHSHCSLHQRHSPDPNPQNSNHRHRCVCVLGWVKCREHISLLVILCMIVYVTKKNKTIKNISVIVLFQNRYPIIVKCLNIWKNIGKPIYRLISSVYVCVYVQSVAARLKKVWTHVTKLSYTSVRCNVCSSVIVNKGCNTSHIMKYLLTKHNM